MAVEHSNFEHYTKKEVAHFLRVTTRTIENYVKKGVLPPPLKVSGKALWSVAAIRALSSTEEEVRP